MKLIFIHLLAYLSFIICSAQNDSKKNKLMIPKIDKKIEKFDIKEFEINKVGKERFVKKDNILVQEISFSFGYIQRNFFNNLHFKLNKKFGLNGVIIEKGILFNNGSQYGIWYEFDEEGNLVKEINTDEGYDFGWQEVIAYCEKKEIELTKGYEKGGYQTEILKQEENDKKVWVISYLVSPVLICRETLDGVTGKLLNSEEFEFINH